MHRKELGAIEVDYRIPIFVAGLNRKSHNIPSVDPTINFQLDRRGRYNSNKVFFQLALGKLNIYKILKV